MPYGYFTALSHMVGLGPHWPKFRHFYTQRVKLALRHTQQHSLQEASTRTGQSDTLCDTTPAERAERRKGDSDTINKNLARKPGLTADERPLVSTGKQAVRERARGEFDPETLRGTSTDSKSVGRKSTTSRSPPTQLSPKQGREEDKTQGVYEGGQKAKQRQQSCQQRTSPP